MNASVTPDLGRDIALVGIGCRFPGGVIDVATFWEFLSAGRNAIGDIPSDRMDVAALVNNERKTNEKAMVNRGGYLERIEEFDAAFFGISPREAEVLDPQQRLLLETAWEALEDAGQDVTTLASARTGVFVGQWTSDFEERLIAHPEKIDFFAVQGSGRYASSGRISYALGLRGPSLTVDTACSSALVAVHLAAQSLRSGECEAALVGAVNVILQAHVSIAYSRAGMLARDGQCKFGDESGDGYVRSEGAAVLFLKPLARARADGDRVYAVIKGSAVRNDGSSSGSMGTPSLTGQTELLRAAYEDAGVLAARLAYVEAHGTGTRAGDPVELKALATVAGGNRALGRPLYVGSAKTNWGHTEAAAGLAGLIKAALVLHHRTIPPSLNCSTPSSLLAAPGCELTIPSKLVLLPGGEGPSVAGVTALGISGTNAHVVLEEAHSVSSERLDAFERWAPAILLPLSARSPRALRELAVLTAKRLQSLSAPAISDLCWSAARRRTALSHRAAFVAESSTALIEALRGFAESDDSRATQTAPKIVFVCPGQGAQWAGMARKLMRRHPSFLGALAECDKAALPHMDYSILEQLEADPGQEKYRLDEISVIQPVLVALAIAYARLLGEFGVVPSAVVGHSMGEVAAACIAGVISIGRAMEIICRRSALMQEMSGKGAMAVVELSMLEAETRLAGWSGQVTVAVSNSARSSVISGEARAVRQVMDELERDGVFCRAVKVDVASHSPQMDHASAALASELAGMETHEARIPIWSTVLGRRAEGGEFGAAYWGRNLREPVRFADTVNGLLDSQISVFVELGPHPVLLHAVEQTVAARVAVATTVACGRREEDDNASLLAALGRLWVDGYTPAWDRVLPTTGRFVPLPLYPWQREKHWAPSAKLISASSTRQAPEAPRDDEMLSWLYRQVWKTSDPPLLWAGPSAARYLIVGTGDEAGAAFRQAFAATGADAAVVRWSDLDRALVGGAAALAGIVLLMPEGSQAPFLPIHALQCVLKLEGRARPRLWVLTRGARVVDPHRAERPSIDQAAAWGGCRLIAEEHPDVWGGLVDLDPDAAATDDCAQVARHILAADGEDQMAIRGGRRFVVRLTPLALDASANAFRARRDAAYLITGGFGYIGLQLAKAIVARGARRLILLGHSAPPARDSWTAVDPDSVLGQRIAAIRALEREGVAVHLANIDVSDETALRGFLDRYAAEAWPPIRGVIHSAGAVDDCLVHAIDAARYNALLGPKLRGAQHLDRLLPDLDFFALMSSMATFLPHSGQVNYAAANAGLDALALDRRARGSHAVSIDWGVWEDTGLLKGVSGEVKTEILRRPGIRVIPAARGADLFALLCQSGETVAAVLPIDWAEFKQARSGRNYPIFADNIAAAEAKQNHAGAAVRTSVSPDSLDQTVRKAVGAVLKIPASRLDPRMPLGAMGLTSLMAIELRNLLEGALKRPLSATLAWNHPTIEALVAFLGEAGARSAAESDALAATPVEPMAISDLSEAEALAALLSASDGP